jgi:hypothetical protein
MMPRRRGIWGDRRRRDEAQLDVLLTIGAVLLSPLVG